MSQIEKRLDRMRSNPEGWRYRDLARILQAFGFTTTSTGGSHRVFKHPSGARIGLVESGSGTVLSVYTKAVVAKIDALKEMSDD